MKQGTAGRGPGDRLAKFISTKAIKPFVSDGLGEMIKNPIKFKTENMKKILVLVAVAALLQGVAVAQEVINPTGLQWNPNSEPDLAGYKVYERTSGGAYEELAVCTADTTQINFGPATPHPDGTYAWVVTAYDTAGNESGYSNEATASWDTGAPAPPTGCATIP